MQHGCRSSVLLIWVLAFALGLIACSSGVDPAAIRAEQAWPQALLWDPSVGDTVAIPVERETLDSSDFHEFVHEEADRSDHLQMAADMGYAGVCAAGRFTYDNGALMTVGVLNGSEEGDTAMLVVGELPPVAGQPEPPEVVFIAHPVFADGDLVRIDYLSRHGALSLDLEAGEVDLAEASYGSCAMWNCLAGAVHFWWEDSGSDEYLGLLGTTCMDCIYVPLLAPVACPACAVLIGAPVLASVTNCSLWPCDLCINDDCNIEREPARCVTEGGVSFVRESVTHWVCENPKTQYSECVPGETEITILEHCPYGCRPGTYGCQFPTQCIVGLPCGRHYLTDPVCVGDQLWTPYEDYGCVATDDPAAGGRWGTCELVGSGILQIQCPHSCADGMCQSAPTCDPNECELSEPIWPAQPYCEFRPQDGTWALSMDYRERACRPVLPGVEACVEEQVAHLLEECPFGCAGNGRQCADVPACSASGMAPGPVPQELPAAVAETRSQIVAAAVACDYDALSTLASSADYFAYSPDEIGTPAEYWQSMEQGGAGQPLLSLVTTLNLQAEAAGVGGTEGAFYLWSDGAGGVTEYRLGISAEGQWLFFLADD